MTEIRPSKVREGLDRVRTELGRAVFEQASNVPPPNPPLKQIPTALKELEIAQETLRKGLMELEQRLYTVMSPIPPSETKPTGTGGSTEVGAYIEMQVLCIHESVELVQSIINRLEI
jgi:hypothetical protein